MSKIRLPQRCIAALSIVVVLATGLITGVAPGKALAAAPQIKLSKFVVPSGSAVTVQGSNFHPGDKVSVSLLYAAAGPDSMRQLGTGKADIGGGGGFSGDLTVPSGTQAGLYMILASDAHGNSAFQPLQVPVQVRVTAGGSGPHIYPVPGLVVQLSGTGFKAGEKVDLAVTFPQYAGSPIKVAKSVTTDSNGAFSAVSIQVPWNTKDGSVPLTVTGASSGSQSAVTVTLQVSHRPFLLLASTKVSAGDILRAQIAGFAPGDRLTVVTTVTRLSASDLRIVKTVQAGNRGMVGVSLSLPRNAKSGRYVVTAIVAGTHVQASARFTAAGSTPGPAPTATPAPKATAAPSAKASLQVAPRAVIPGASAEALGTGFPASTRVVVRSSVGRTNAAPQQIRVTATTDKKGSFAATVQVPGDAAAGGYTVTARGGGRSASDTLHVAYLRTAVVALPARAIPGTPITVTGVGYASGATVTISLDGANLGTVSADKSGKFKTQVTIPGSTATGMRGLTAKDSAGRSATFSLQVYRHISTHFYFASLFTGSGFHEYLLFTNATAIKAAVHITYQRQHGAPTYKTISVPAHSHLTHDVNADLGANVTGAATVAADVPVSAERMVMRGRDGSIDPGASAPSQTWYFANGNTSHGYQEQIAVQNPTAAWAQVTVQVQPTHSRTYQLHGTMHPQSRMSWNLNSSSRDAVGVIVTANRPVVANRTIFVHNGVTSKTGVPHPGTHWYFAAGPNRSNTRHWIGVINTTGQSSYMVLQAYNAQGAQVASIKKWLRPYDRQGYLMNHVAGQTEVAVTVSTSRPSIAEQSTFISGSHDAHTDTFGVTAPTKTAEFAVATTWSHQDNLLALFNPNAAAIPVVVQFLNTHGGTSQQTYIVAPFAHAYIDVGKAVPNSQLGLLAVSSYNFVALDRQEANDGAGAMITLGTQS